MTSFVFDQLDSWCFREAKPMGSVGGLALASVFPPPASTIIGACRTFIAETQSVDWQLFAKGEQPELSALIGDASQTGQLRFSHPYLVKEQNGKTTRFYPAPATLVKNEDTVFSLFLGKDIVECDLGLVMLPNLPAKALGAKPLSNCYIGENALYKLLNKQSLAISDVVQLDDFIHKEPRLGIARDNQKATVISGAMYQTEHIRIKNAAGESIKLAVDCQNIPSDIVAECINKTHNVRLGGEGRVAFVETMRDATNTNAMATKPIKGNHALLYFISPIDAGGDMLSEFTRVDTPQQTYWEAQIADCKLKILSSVMHKGTKVGGWDSAKNHAKPVRSLIGAGSCFFIECDALDTLQKALHTYRFGQQTHLGFGHAMLLPANIHS